MTAEPAPTDDLAWVRWLLGSVRARCRRIHFTVGPASPETAWAHFIGSLFLPVIGPQMLKAWQAAGAGSRSGLAEAAAALAGGLDEAAVSHSSEAGQLMLRSTRSARYQGVLGRHRADVGDGKALCQFPVVWAATGHFFQLSFAVVLAEFLRLEWEIATDGRHLSPLPTTTLLEAISQLVKAHAAEPTVLRP